MNDQVEGFADNWAYLKTELAWLEKLLMVAVARQRKEAKEVEQTTKSRGDRAASHWWKGIVSLEGTAAYDEHRKPTSGSPTGKNYQQQLEARIQASHQQGVVLALPSLRDRLNLTQFEKNLVLMSLAPEVNRRYARIYRYLQGEDAPKTDLPTVDLVLRLLCRNDQEWRVARDRLFSHSPLLQYHLLQILPHPDDTLLNYPIKLQEDLVSYLLADQPVLSNLDRLFIVSAIPPAPLLLQETVSVDWQDLVLPEELLTSLRSLTQKLEWGTQVHETWGFGQSPLDPPPCPGTIALLAGASGTGKTIAARAIAHTLQAPLTTVDLSLVDAPNFVKLLQEINSQKPLVLLIKSAEKWLRRSSSLPESEIRQFFIQRANTPTITLLSVPQKASVRLVWQRLCDRLLEFPVPEWSDRLRLWQTAFPTQMPLNAQLNWEQLARSHRLTGGEIRAIARTAAFCLAASGETALSQHHLEQALQQYRRKK